MKNISNEASLCLNQEKIIFQDVQKNKLNSKDFSNPICSFYFRKIYLFHYFIFRKKTLIYFIILGLIPFIVIYLYRLIITLQLYIITYIYVCVCVCVCMRLHT